MSDVAGVKLKPEHFEINAQGQVVIKHQKVAALLKKHAIVAARGKPKPKAAAAVILVPGGGG
jgi:hypothetical protein